MRQKNKESNITFPFYPARRQPLLAPLRRQSLNPPSGSPLFLPTGLPGPRRALSSLQARPIPEGPLFPTGPPDSRRALSFRRPPFFLPEGAHSAGGLPGPRWAPSSGSGPLSSPMGHLFPEGPSDSRRAPTGGSLTPFKSKFVGSRGTKSEKCALFDNCNRKLKLYP